LRSGDLWRAARKLDGNRNRITIRAVRAVGPCTSEW